METIRLECRLATHGAILGPFLFSRPKQKSKHTLRLSSMMLKRLQRFEKNEETDFKISA